VLGESSLGGESLLDLRVKYQNVPAAPAANAMPTPSLFLLKTLASQAAQPDPGGLLPAMLDTNIQLTRARCTVE